MSKDSLEHYLDGLFSDHVPEPDRPQAEPPAVEPAAVEPAQPEPQPPSAAEQLPGEPVQPPSAQQTEPQPSPAAGQPPIQQAKKHGPQTRPTPRFSVQNWFAFQEQDIAQGRAYILNLVLGGTLISGAIGVAAMIFGLFSNLERLDGYLPFFIGYLLILGLFIWRRPGTFWRAVIFLALVYVLALISFWYNGPAGTGPWYLLGLPLLFFVLIGPRAGIVSSIIHILVYWVLVVLYRLSILRVPQPIELHDSEAQFLVIGATFTLITLVLGLVFWLYSRIQSQILHQLQEQYRSLQEAQGIIAERAEELILLNRTLQRQTAYFELGAQVGRLATRSLQQKEFVGQVINMVRDQLDLACVSLYQLDDRDEVLILLASAQKVDVKREPAMRVRLKTTGPLRECIQSGEACIVNIPAENLEEGLMWPDARSVLLLPLIAQDQTIGCVVIQSAREAAFLPEDVLPLRTFADQVAVAMAYDRTVLELRQRVAEIENLQRYYVREAWQQFLPTRKQQLFQFVQPGLSPLSPAEVDRLVFDSSQTDLTGGVVVPLVQRGQTIGLLGLLDVQEGQLRDEGQMSVVRAVLEQMELILDNARLFEEARLRAGQERRVRDIATRLRETLDVESVLRTAIDQIYQTLGLEEVLVHLRVGTEMPQSTGPTDAAQEQDRSRI